MKIKSKRLNSDRKNRFPDGNWIDVSISLKKGMVQWPGDSKFAIKRKVTKVSSGRCQISEIRLGSHTGTHIDAPLHYISGGNKIQDMPFTAVIGTARLVEIQSNRAVGAADFKGLDIIENERIILKTRNSRRNWESKSFKYDYTCLDESAAEYLVEKNIMTLGVDYLSVGGPDSSGDRVHKLLLSAGIWIIEGLNLHFVEPGIYEMICLPLKIFSGDGSPARAVLKPL